MFFDASRATALYPARLRLCNTAWPLFREMLRSEDLPPRSTPIFFFFNVPLSIEPPEFYFFGKAHAQSLIDLFLDFFYKVPYILRLRPSEIDDKIGMFFRYGSASD